MEQVVTCQGKLFTELIRTALASGQVRPMPPEIALCYFTGVMLNIPRMIKEGIVKGPALQYVDHVTDSVWQIMRPTC